MKTNALSKRLDNLPEAAQRQVEALISEWEQRQKRDQKRSFLREEPFVGLWKDRGDLSDSTAWVRNTRQTEWQRG